MDHTALLLLIKTIISKMHCNINTCEMNNTEEKLGFQLNHINTRQGGHSSIYAIADYTHKRGFFSSGGDGEVIYWPEASLDEGQVFAREEKPVMCLHYDDHSDELITGTLNGIISWIHVDGKMVTKRQKWINGGIFAITSDEKAQYFAGDDGSLNQLDKTNKQLVNSIQLSAVRSRAILLFHNFIFAGTSEGHIFKIHTEDFNQYSKSKLLHQGSVFGLVSVEDGIISVGKDGRMIKWDDDLHPIIDIQAHNSTINSIVNIGNSGLLATGCRDGSIRIWDSDKLELVKVIDLFLHTGHLRSVNKLMWKDSQSTLISGSDDRQIKLWKIEAS